MGSESIPEAGTLSWIIGATILLVAGIWAWRSDKKSGRHQHSRRHDDRFHSKSNDWFKNAKARFRPPRH